MRTFGFVMVLAAELASPYLAARLAAPCCRPALTVTESRPCGSPASDILAPYVEVREANGQPCGSGTLIRLRGEVLVLTAAHVVEGAKLGRGGRAVCYLWKEEWSDSGDHAEGEEEAEVIYFSPPEPKGHDLALLRPRCQEGFAAAKLGLGAHLSPGDDCWYVGTPAGLHGSLERSIINRVDAHAIPPYPDSRFTIFNGNGWYGNSGGGLYVKRGERYVLVGVVNLLARPFSPRSPLAAEPPDVIRRFLDDYIQAQGGDE